MIRRNIDTSIGLANETIGIVESVSKDLYGEIESVNVLINDVIHSIKRMTVNFEVYKGVSIARHQFPLMLSDTITIHKSQGLSLNCVLIDAGQHNFAPGQIYVALSRVTSLNGLHLINFDPHKIIADKRAILEYNRLRSKYKSDIPIFINYNIRGSKIKDSIWTVPKRVLQAQKGREQVNRDFLNIRSLQNEKKINDFINNTIQILVNSQQIRDQIALLPNSHILKIILNEYISGKLNNLLSLKEYAGNNFTLAKKHCLEDFFNNVINLCASLKEIIYHNVVAIYCCDSCQKSFAEEQENNILLLNVHNDIKKTYDLQEIINMNLSS